MKKLLILLLPLIIAAKCEPSAVLYKAPDEQECMILSQWNENIGQDEGSCFCIDKNITNEQKLRSILIPRVEKAFNGHPLKEMALLEIETTIPTIIATKEYELPLAYCRGYFATDASARARLEKWAEDNRLKRIECEVKKKR